MSTTVSNTEVFLLVVPDAAISDGPMTGPWRPLVWRVDLSGLGTTATWGGITGTLAAQADLGAALALRAPLLSPSLSGTPTAPTAAPGTNTTQVASTAYADAAVAVEAAARTAADSHRPVVYNAGGLVTAPKVWVGTASIGATGAWSADVSSASFAAITCVLATVQRNSATVTVLPATTILTVSTTTVTGQCWDGRTLAVLGDTVEQTTNAAPTTTVHLVVHGT